MCACVRECDCERMQVWVVEDITDTLVAQEKFRTVFEVSMVSHPSSVVLSFSTAHSPSSLSLSPTLSTISFLSLLIYVCRSPSPLVSLSFSLHSPSHCC